MVDIKKAKAEDFENIYPLLQQLDNSRLTKHDWRQLFISHWSDKENYFGHVMMDKDKAVGFLGLLFSERVINDRVEKICNLTSWIVKEQYKSQSVLLLFPVLRMEDYTTTVFTPSQVTYSVLKTLGYKNISSNRRIIPPLPVSSRSNKDYSVEFENEAIRNCLSGKVLKIYHDHLRFKCIHLVIRMQGASCYIILKKRRIRGLPFAYVHFLSDLSIFSAYIHKASSKICAHLKILGLVIDERYLRGQRLKNSFTIRSSAPLLYRSNSLKKEDIDTLYSELFILDL